uniref:Uncharacterized protein n=1 Tax=Rhizophora mucronata TaxID=61149 RepID=A0A2P2P826_RHIMU
MRYAVENFVTYPHLPTTEAANIHQHVFSFSPPLKEPLLLTKRRKTKDKKKILNVLLQLLTKKAQVN